MIGSKLIFSRKPKIANPHENLWLQLPEYGTIQREDRVNLLTTILRDFFETDLPNLDPYCKTQQQRQYLGATFGEHYRLINSLCKTLKLDNVVEVGSFTGMSALIWLINDVSLTSIDVVPWDNFEDTVLNEEMTQQSHFSQKILDISMPSSFSKMVPEFKAADLIFLDGPKDGVFEQKVVPEIIALMKGTSAWLLLDDIYLRAMKPCWDEIKNEKYDLSLIGHTSGTGLVRL